jgi:hypothetical protein
MRAPAALLAAALSATPAFAAAGASEAVRPVDPCGESTVPCQPMTAVTPDAGDEEPVVIYLDADGNEIVRVPLSRFRKDHPEAHVPDMVPGGR